MELSNIINQLLNQNRLTDAGAAEESDFAALSNRADQIDHFDAGLE